MNKHLSFILLWCLLLLLGTLPTHSVLAQEATDPQVAEAYRLLLPAIQANGWQDSSVGENELIPVTASGLVTTSGIITTIAGSGPAGNASNGSFYGNNVPATTARLFQPKDAAVAPDGSVYIADWYNNRVRRVGLDGIITTIVDVAYDQYGPLEHQGCGSQATVISPLLGPYSLAFGPDGSLYISETDGSRIRKLSPNGQLTTVAGKEVVMIGKTWTCYRGYSGDGGPATQAMLNAPKGVAVGPDGSLYIADTGNHRVRRVGPDGIITTVAGNSTRGYSGDGGLAVNAQLGEPHDVVVSADGTLYIAEYYNNRIRRVSPNGIITTFAGGGSSSADGVPATSSSLQSPVGLALGVDGSLYIAAANGQHIKRVAPNGIITRVVGHLYAAGFSGDGGLAIQARLFNPVGLAVGPDGSLYIADSNNQRIRVVR